MERLTVKKTIAPLMALLMIISLFGCNKPAQPMTAGEYLSLGEKFLLELDYEQALVQFLKVIEIDPMNPRGYTGAAEAYVGLGQMDDAVAVLLQGLDAIPGDAGIQAMLDGLSSSAASEQIATENEPGNSSEPTQIVTENEPGDIAEPTQRERDMAAYSALNDDDKALLDRFAMLHLAKDYDGTLALWSEDGVISAIESLMSDDEENNGWKRYRIDDETRVSVGINDYDGRPNVEVAQGRGRDGIVVNSRFLGEPYFILSTNTYAGGVANGPYASDWYNEPGGEHLYRSVEMVNGLAQGECVYYVDGTPNMKIEYKDGSIAILGERDGEIAIQMSMSSGELIYQAITVEQANEWYPKIERAPYSFDD